MQLPGQLEPFSSVVVVSQAILEIFVPSEASYDSAKVRINRETLEKINKFKTGLLKQNFFIESKPNYINHRIANLFGKLKQDPILESNELSPSDNSPSSFRIFKFPPLTTS